MKVLMFGWEFPPFNTGGLGTACYGLTKGLTRNGVEIIFVLPRTSGMVSEDYMKILKAENIEIDEKKIKFVSIESILKPYASINLPIKQFDIEKIKAENVMYGEDIFAEVFRYAQEAKLIAMIEDYDVIHCHDWLTFPSGIEAKMAALKKGKNVPLIVHVHATEYDRTVGNPNPKVYEIEKKGMEEADYVIAVSHYTKNIIVKHYGIPEEKIVVVHNSIDPEPTDDSINEENFKIKQHYKIVLFLGRLTIQKGPDHFLWVAKKVSEVDENVRFIIAGNGDMFPFIVEEAANLGIGDKVLFADFLRGRDVDRAYKMADVFVMTSISEPFGIAALEAMKNGTPVIVSKQSGVSEVMKSCLVADFWDINEIANKIIALLKNPELVETLREEMKKEIRNFSWDIPARKCIDLYKRAISQIQNRPISKADQM